MNSTPFNEPQVLCPNCGSLSPVGTKKCDCGYQLKRSVAPYVVTAVVVVALLVMSVWLIAFSVGRGDSDNTGDVVLSQSLTPTVEPTPSAITTPVPEPENSLNPIYIDRLSID